MATPLSLRFRLFRAIARSSNWFDRKFTAAGRLSVLALVVATIFGLDPRQTSAFQLAALLAALILCATMLSSRWRPAIEVKRALPRYVTVGEPARYRLELFNRGDQLIKDVSIKDVLHTAFPAISELSDPMQSIGRPPESNWFDRKIGFVTWLHRFRLRRGATIEVATAEPLPPKSATTVQQTLVAQRRGVITFSGIELRRPEPLGLMRGHHSLALPGKVISLPKRYPIPRIDWPSRRYFHRGGMNLANSVGDSQEFIGLRDYRPGDPFRQIHWKSFAKLGQPIVREYQDEYFNHHALVFDPTVIDGSPEVFECAVAVTASFVQTKHPNDALLDLVMIGQETWHLTSGRGLDNSAHLLEHLAMISPRRQAPDELSFNRVTKKLAKCSTLIFVCCEWGETQRTLVTRLQSAGVSTLALRVVPQTHGASDHTELSVTNIEQQLAGINASLLRQSA